jgi:hypothetical protein
MDDQSFTVTSTGCLRGIARRLDLDIHAMSDIDQGFEIVSRQCGRVDRGRRSTGTMIMDKCSTSETGGDASNFGTPHRSHVRRHFADYENQFSAKHRRI